MNSTRDVAAAVQFIRTRFDSKPSLGMVLGSGLGAFSARLERSVKIPYASIPDFPTSSVAGHAGELVLGYVGGVACAVMSGRVHYYEGYSMQDVTFPIRVLARLGCTSLLVTNAAGGVDAAFAPGDFMVITDQINLTGQNPLRGHNDDSFGPRFPDMSQAYTLAGQKALHETAKTMGLTLREGVYAGLTGPSYETPAEIRMLQKMGAHAVGMSTVCEVIVAAHAGLKVTGLSVITNRAAGLSSTPLTHEEVKEVGQRVQGVLCDLLWKAVPKL